MRVHGTAFKAANPAAGNSPHLVEGGASSASRPKPSPGRLLILDSSRAAAHHTRLRRTVAGGNNNALGAAPEAAPQQTTAPHVQKQRDIAAPRQLLTLSLRAICEFVPNLVHAPKRWKHAARSVCSPHTRSVCFDSPTTSSAASLAAPARHPLRTLQCHGGRQQAAAGGVAGQRHQRQSRCQLLRRAGREPSSQARWSHARHSGPAAGLRDGLYQRQGRHGRR